MLPIFRATVQGTQTFTSKPWHSIYHSSALSCLCHKI